MCKKFLILGAFFALTGCIQSFTPPLDGPTAQLSERNSATASVAIYRDPIECKHPRSLYSLFSRAKNQFVSIPANKPLTLRVTTYADFSEAPEFDNVTFIPEAGQKYTVERHYSRNARFIYHVQILKIVREQNKKTVYLPVKYIKREDGFFSECTDTQMKESIKGITASY